MSAFMSPRQLLVVSIVVAVPSLALAQEPPPPPPPPAPAPVAPPAPVVATPAAPVPVAPPSLEPADGPPDGWQLQARLPTALGADSLLTPGFSIGHRSKNVVWAVELGLTGGKFSEDQGMGASTSESVLLFQVVPMFYDDLWVSADGRARFNIVAGIGYGRGSITTDNNDGMGTTSEQTAYVSYLPILGGFGGDYYLSRNFALGVEFGAFVPVLLSVNSGGMDANVSGALESLRGMIRFTFVTGP